MIEVWCRSLETGEEFTRYFDSPYLARNFIRKCNFGHRVYILGWVGM